VYRISVEYYLLCIGFTNAQILLQYLCMREIVENANKVINSVIFPKPVPASCGKVIRAELFSFLYNRVESIVLYLLKA